MEELQAFGEKVTGVELTNGERYEIDSRDVFAFYGYSDDAADWVIIELLDDRYIVRADSIYAYITEITND